MENGKVIISGEVFLKITSAYDNLGRAEQRVASFIQNYPEEILKLPINVLADKVGVAVSTVVRLCRRIGLDGYSDLKIALAKDLALNYREIYQEIDTTDSLVSILNKARLMQTQAIDSTFKLLSEEQLQKACRTLDEAGAVLVIGTGGTAAIAKLFSYKLLKLGLNSQWSSDFTTVPLLLNRMTPLDVLFAISHSGSTHDVCESLATAKDKGCKTIVLTNYSHSLLAKEADIVLTTAVKPSPLGSEGGVTRITQISVLEVVCLLLALHHSGVYDLSTGSDGGDL